MKSKSFLGDRELGYVENVWTFKSEEHAGKVYDVTKTDEFKISCGKIDAVIEKYSCDDAEFAFRVYATVGSINYIVDRVKAKEDVCIYSHFCIENSSKLLSVNVADKSKLVVRNGNDAFKFFRLAGELDGNDVLASGGLLLPDGVAENGVDTGMSFYTGLHNFGKDHTAIFCICTGHSDSIPGWHMKRTDDGGYLAEPKGKVGSYKLFSQDDMITVVSLDDQNEKVVIDLKKYI